MAINWCYGEPWKCAVNNSLIAWPERKKDAYYAVRDSLRDVLGSAEIPKFMWSPGETMVLVPWLLNDTRDAVGGTVTLSVLRHGEKTVLGSADLEAKPLGNAKGEAVTWQIPEDAAPKERFTVTAELDRGDGDILANSYELVIETR